jgi:hypothetical protein
MVRHYKKGMKHRFNTRPALVAHPLMHSLIATPLSSHSKSQNQEKSLAPVSWSHGQSQRTFLIHAEDKLLYLQDKPIKSRMVVSRSLSDCTCNLTRLPPQTVCTQMCEFSGTTIPARTPLCARFSKTFSTSNSSQPPHTSHRYT